jgi:hypothetical protein
LIIPLNGWFKGSGIAIMDADKYKDEIESDLNDNTT